MTSRGPQDLRTASIDELDRIAQEAFTAAAREALAAGIPVTGMRDGTLVRRYPDGTVEVIPRKTSL